MSSVFILVFLDLSAAFDIIKHFAGPALRIGMGGHCSAVVLLSPWQSMLMGEERSISLDPCYWGASKLKFATLI